MKWGFGDEQFSLLRDLVSVEGEADKAGVKHLKFTFYLFFFTFSLIYC